MIPVLVGGIGGVISKAGGLGGVLGKIGGVFGFGKPSNTNPAARKLQDELTQFIISVEAAGYKKGKTDPGSYVLDVRDGKVYQSKADGLHAIGGPWATGITADWRAKNPMNPNNLSAQLHPSLSTSTEARGPNMLVVGAVGAAVVLALVLVKGRR